MDQRTYPASDVWQAVAEAYLEYVRRVGTPSLLASLALGTAAECPFPLQHVAFLKKVVENQAEKGTHLKRSTLDREELPIDFRYLQLLLDAAEDPSKSL